MHLYSHRLLSASSLLHTVIDFLSNTGSQLSIVLEQVLFLNTWKFRRKVHDGASNAKQHEE